MAKTQRLPTSQTQVRSGAWTGWVVFASLMLSVVGGINIVQGLVALAQDDYFLVPNGDQLPSWPKVYEMNRSTGVKLSTDSFGTIASLV